MKFFKGEKGKKYLEYLFLIVIAIFFYKLVDMLPADISGIKVFFSIASPIIAGFVITFLLHLPALKIENLLKKTKGFFSKHSRGISVLLTYIAFFGIIALLIYAIIPIVAKNVVEFGKNIPQYTENAKKMLEEYMDEEGKIWGINVAETINNIPALVSRFLSPEKIMSVIGSVYSIGSSIITVILSLIISVYMMLDRDSLIKTCGKVLGIFMRGKTVSTIHDYLKRISNIFYRYVYSQLIDALIVSILFSITFYCLRIPYAIFFGVLIGVLNLVPYFGAIIGGVAVSLVTLITNGLTSAIITAVLILVIQQVDANIIQPRIVGETVGIRPLYVLAAITIGGGLFGFFGVLISVPVVASIRMIMIDLVEYTSKKRKAERLILVKKNEQQETNVTE